MIQLFFRFFSFRESGRKKSAQFLGRFSVYRKFSNGFLYRK